MLPKHVDVLNCGGSGYDEIQIESAMFIGAKLPIDLMLEFAKTHGSGCFGALLVGGST